MTDNVVWPRHGWVRAIVETTYGSDPGVASADAMILRGEPEITVNQEPVERNITAPEGGGTAHGIIDDNVEYSFQVALAPIDFSDGATPSCAPLLKGGAGMSETTGGSTASPPVTADYKFQTTGKGSNSLRFTRQDKDTGDYTNIDVLGARHNVTVTLGENAEILIDVEGMGLYGEWQAFGSLTAPSSFGNGLTPFLAHDLTAQWDYAAATPIDLSVTNADFQTGYSVEEIGRISGDPQTKEIFLNRENQGGRPQMSFDPLQLDQHYAASGSLKADKRSASEKEARVEADLASNADRKFWIHANAAQMDSLGDSADSGKYRWDMGLALNRDRANDEPEAALHWEAAS